MINLYCAALISPSSKAVRAILEFSASSSIEVSTPCFARPLNIHNPLTPEPVPTSTTEVAPIKCVKYRSSEPTIGVVFKVPISSPRARARCVTVSSGK